MKEKMVVSISGGESSGNMSRDLKVNYGHIYDFTFIFANTGMENNETLDFVNKCDIEFDLNIVWVEAVVNPIHGKGITHRVTNYEKAFRVNQYKDPLHPFHAHVAKSGIPNPNKPQCSDRLKAFAIEDYKKKNGLKGVKHAIGIRSDESGRATPADVRKALVKIGLNSQKLRCKKPGDRLPALNRFVEYHKIKNKINELNDKTSLSVLAVEQSVESKFFNSTFKKLESKFFTKENLKRVTAYIGKLNDYNLVYPMCDWFETDKVDVKDFWESQSFQLQLEDHEGNCQVCWKKSDRKLSLLAIEHPERFEAFNWLEKTYKHVKPNLNGVDRVFFRRNRSSEMILEESKMFDGYDLRKLIGASVDDQSAGCAESCNSYDI